MTAKKISLRLGVAVFLLALMGVGVGLVVNAQGPGATSWTSYPYILNLGTVDAHVVLEFYTPDGAVAASGGVFPDIAPGTSRPIMLSDYGVPNDFRGSIVMYSDQPLATISGQAGDNSAAFTYAGVSIEEAATTYQCPSIHRDTWRSLIAIQNTGSTDASVEIEFFQASDGASVGTTSPLAVKVNSSLYVVTEDYEAMLGTAFNGGAQVRSIGAGGEKIVVVVNEYLSGTNPYFLNSAYTCFTSGATMYYLPSQHYQESPTGWVAYDKVMNMSGAPVTIEMKFYEVGSTTPVTTTTRTIASGTRDYPVRDFVGTSGTDMFNGFATIEVTSGGDIAVMVGELRYDQRMVAQYNGIPSGAKVLYFPSQHTPVVPGSGWSSWNKIQNLESTQANLTLRYYDSLGTEVCTVDVDLPGDSTYDIANLTLLSAWTPASLYNYTGSLGYNFRGSLKVESDRDIVGICGEVALGATVDGTVQYNGIAAP